jgi:hypothetical protein
VDDDFSLDEPAAAAPIPYSEPPVAEDEIAQAPESLPLDEPLLDEPADEGPSVDVVADIDEIDVDEFDEVDVEPQPESGPVAAAPATMDEALYEAEHQPPLTPPPESGEEIMTPHIPSPGPTMEQLGQTISLDEGQRHDLELDEPVLEEPLEEPPSYMEAAIPSAPPHSDHFEVPDNAREELERLRLGDATPIEARVSKRPVISTNVVEFVTASRRSEPQTFADVVDSSLSLG